MAVIHLSKSGEFISNCLSVVGLPPTGPSNSPNYKLSFPRCLSNNARTAEITGVFNDRLDDMFDNNYYCCDVDGGSA
jgi:hypothetical protein